MRYSSVLKKIPVKTVITCVILFALTVIGAYEVVAEQLSTDDDGSFAWMGTASDSTDSTGYIMLTCVDENGDPVTYINGNGDERSRCYDEQGTPDDFTDDILIPNVVVDPDPTSGAADDERIDGWAWVGTAYDASDTSIGWLNFDPSPVSDFATANGGPCDVTYFGDSGGYPDEPCVPASIDSESGELYGWARFETLADYGLTEFGHDDWGWVLLRGDVSDNPNTADIESGPFGAYMSNGRLYGWAWSANGTDGGGATELVGTGLGWIDFSSSRFVNVGSASTNDFVGFEGGNVYANAGLQNTSSASTSNAAFLLVYNTNNGFSNITSTGDSTIGDTVEDDTGASIDQNYIENITASTVSGINYELPANTNANGLFTNALGSINVRELVTNVDTTGIAPANSYGNTLDLDTSQPYADITDWMATLTENAQTGTKYVEFDDTVVVIDANINENSGLGDDQPWTIPTSGNDVVDYVIEDAIVFKNTTGSANASGTIVVSGDLYINNNMFYNRTQAADITNIANVSWIVLGDVYVAPEVSSIVGSFYIFGDGDGDTTSGSRNGNFSSGNSTTQLRISGLVMANRFRLQRQYEGFGESETAASELFYYDGRAVVNPSPGLRDFSATLPTFYQTISN